MKNKKTKLFVKLTKPDVIDIHAVAEFKAGVRGCFFGEW